MRANSPVSSDFGVINLPTDDEPTPLQRLSKQELDLAKAAKSADGKIILDHLQKRVNTFTEQIKIMDLASMDHITALARTMAAQLVIAEFESVLNDSQRAIKAVKDAAKQS